MIRGRAPCAFQTLPQGESAPLLPAAETGPREEGGDTEPPGSPGEE